VKAHADTRHECRGERFAADEAAYFEAAQASRQKAWEYLVELPQGPHAAAAAAIVDAFDTRLEELALARLVADTRRTEATLDRARDARKRVSALLTAELRAVLDPKAYGVPVLEVPEPLRRALHGSLAEPTLAWTPARREDALFFTIPTPEGSEDCVATIVLDVKTDPGGLVTEARVFGPDLFVRWLEADENVALDPSLPSARVSAAAHAERRLAGILEATLPQDRCGGVDSPGDVLARRCDGWVAVAWMGSRPGERDFVAVRGPGARAERAEDGGMR